MRYQFLIDSRPSSPIRKTWREAADDCVNQGYGVWVNRKSIKLDATQGAEIARIEERPGAR